MHTLLNKVAIVDDDPTVLQVLTAYLKASGYEVYAASTGRQALELVEQYQPSYFIVDWEMPEMNGIELCRRARKLELAGYLYIIFLTARSGIDDLVAAMDAGADDFLNKPLNHSELTARLAPRASASAGIAIIPIGCPGRAHRTVHAPGTGRIPVERMCPLPSVPVAVVGGHAGHRFLQTD